MDGKMYIKVGNGSKTKILERWLDRSNLSWGIFSDLFLICENPDAKVSDCWTWTEQGWDIF